MSEAWSSTGTALGDMETQRNQTHAALQTTTTVTTSPGNCQPEILAEPSETVFKNENEIKAFKNYNGNFHQETLVEIVTQSDDRWNVGNVRKENGKA